MRNKIFRLQIQKLLFFTILLFFANMIFAKDKHNLEIDSIFGTVTQDMYPLKMLKYLEDVNVYLEKEIISNSGKYTTYIFVDSTKTNSLGRYVFYKVSDSISRISFKKEGYYGRNLSFIPKQFQYPISLLPNDAHAIVKGKVVSHGNCTYYNGNPLCTGLLVPVEGCTVFINIPRLSITLNAITDNGGNYSFDSIPLVVNGDTFELIASKCDSFGKDKEMVVLYNNQTQTVNFNLETSFTNTAINTNDSLIFTITTNKINYIEGDSIFVRYSFENNSNSPKYYYYTPGCQFDVIYSGIKGDTIYQYMKNRACPLIIGFDTLKPHKQISFNFPGFYVNKSIDSVLTICAKTFSFPNSDVIIKVYIKKLYTNNLLSNFKKNNNKFYSAELFDKSLLLKIHVLKYDYFTIDIFDLSGRKINQICEKELSPGIYSYKISDYSHKLSRGTYIIRIKNKKEIIQKLMLIKVL